MCWSTPAVGCRVCGVLRPLVGGYCLKHLPPVQVVDRRHIGELREKPRKPVDRPKG